MGRTDTAFQYPELTQELLDEIVKRILAAGSPSKIVLFGSRARGDDRTDSDLDLLIVEDSDVPRHKRAIPYYLALADIRLPKDIVVWTPSEIDEWAKVKYAFVTTAIREGKTLYAK